MSIIDKLRAVGTSSRTSLDRDIYLARQMIALGDIVDTQVNILSQRIDTLEKLIAGPNLPQSHLDLAERMMGLSLRLTTVEKLANER